MTLSEILVKETAFCYVKITVWTTTVFQSEIEFM